MKFSIKSEETGSRWEFDIDLEKSELQEFLESDDWIDGPETNILNEDWILRSKGFDVIGLEDKELEKSVVKIKNWFEDQEIDTGDIKYFSIENNHLDEYEEDFDEEDEETEDLFDELFGDED